MNLNKFLLLLILPLLLLACGGEEKVLPIFGQKDIVEKEINGEMVSVEEPIPLPDFSFTDHMGREVSMETVKGKVHIADFFFTSCPTICPKMKKQMKRIHDEFSDTPDLLLLSHSIDPRHDSVNVLNRYAGKLGIDGDRWRFMTGEKKEIYEAARFYMITAAEDKNAPGGYAHSGAFILFDRDHRIRGYYDGTLAEEADNLMDDIRILLKEPWGEEK